MSDTLRPGAASEPGGAHAAATGASSAHSVAARLQMLGITLPSAAIPAAAYVMSAQSGSMLYVSGHIAKRDGAVWTGKLGATLGTDEGRRAARAVAVDLIATLASQVDLERVRIVKLTSLVNSTPEFDEQHLVTNGASELLFEVFGERGKHARSAFGVASLPLGACLEIELIAEAA